MSIRRKKRHSVGSFSALRRPAHWVVEGLERRLLLAAVSWTGGGDGMNWTDPKNWSTGTLPGSTDTVTINATGSPTITIASGSQAVSTLTTSDPITIDTGASLAVGSTLSGSGTLTNSGTLTLKSTTVSVPLVNQGLVTVLNASNSITGVFTASSGSTLSLSDNNNYSQLTISTGFTNDGTISLSTAGTQGYYDTLTVSSGTLTNASDGTIATSGSGSDTQTITAAITSQGMFSVQHGLTISNNSKTLALSSGTLSIGAGQTLKVSAGTLSLGSTLLNGPGTLDATGDTVTLAASQTLTATGMPIILNSATVNGPGTLTNASGNSLTLSATKINAPLVNQGTLAFTSSGSTIAGGFTASPGSTLNLTDNNSYAQLTVSSAFTNDGTIALSTTGTQGYNATLTISSSGTLTNASDGTITASGTGTDSLIITAALNNQGMFNVQHALTLNTGTGSSSNSGTINASAGDLTTNQQSSTDVFTNTGTLTVAAGHFLNFSAGILDLNSGGTVGGAGTLSLSSVTLNLGINLSNGTTALNIPTSTINGPGTLTNASGETMTLNDTKVNAPFVNDGTLIIINTGSTIAGAFTAPASSTVSLTDNNSYSQLTISVSFNNDGVIAMSTTGTQGYNDTLTLSSGATLTNDADGTITATGSGTDALTITGAITNQGTFTVQHSLTVNNGSSTFNAAAGTLTIAGGQTLKVSSGTLSLGSTLLDGTGTLDATNDTVNLATSQTLTPTGVQVIFTNATINGPGTLTNAAGNTLTLSNTRVNAPLINQGTVAVTNSGNTIVGGFTAPSGSILNLIDNGNYADLTVSSFTNDGAILLSSQSNAGYNVTLTISSGTVTNAADGSITASGTGTDALNINGSLSNRGTLTVQHGVTANGGSLDISSGSVSVAAGQTLKATSDTLTLGSTVLAGSGTLSGSGDTVNLTSNQTVPAEGVQFVLTNSTVNGPGTLTNSGTLTLSDTRVNATLVNQATMVVTSTGNTIAGGFTASPGSTMSLSDNTNYAQVTFSSGFTNNGTIAMSTTSSSGYNVTLTMSSGATLTNGADGTISASGSGADALVVTGTLTNQGTISVQSVKLTVSPTNLSANVLTNGTWQVSGGGKLVLPNPVTTDAANIALDGSASIITTSNGTTNALGGLTAISHTGSLTLTGGQVLSVTPSGGTFPNDGTLTIGPGSNLTVSGSFDQDSDGTLVVQIGGASSGNFGQVVATGNVMAGGTVQGSFVNSYDPPDEQSFAVLTGASESNSFVTVAGVTPSGRTLAGHYNSTSALIVVGPLAPSGPVLTPASDTGISQTDGITNVNTPIFTGTSTDAGTVQLYSDGVLVGSGTVAAGGTWNVLTSLLPDGTHAITAVVVDSDSDRSPITSGESVLIDTVAPTIHATINSPAASNWYDIATGPAVVHYTASDNTGGSGLASPVPPDHVFTDGANQSLAGVTISDIAGNTATSQSFSGINQDTVAPTSTVAALPAQETAPFTVNWSGQDNAGGSGLATYSVYVSDNGGAYTALVLNTTSTSQTFTGQPGHTYGFYSVATDIAGNVQPPPTAAQATTAVFTLTTTALSASSPNPSNATQALSFTATVSGGVPNGEMVTLEDASNGNKVVSSGTLSNGSAGLAVPAGTLSTGSHNLIAVYGGDADFTASQSASYAQTILPGITGISPTSGPAAGGTTVTIIGGGFTGATAVDFGSTPSTSFTVNSTGTQITAMDPAGTAGTAVDVTVVTPGGTSVTSAADQFTYFPAWLAAASVATWNASTNTLTVTGAATIIADPGSAEPNIVATGAAAKLTIAPTTSPSDIHIGGVTLTGGASIVMSDVDASQVASGTNASNHHTDHNVLVIGTLGAVNDPTISIDSASKLDLGDNDLIVHTGTSDKGSTDVQGNPETNELKAIEALAATGRNVAPGGVYDGTWTGNGLTSSAAATADDSANAGYEQNILAVEQNSDMYLGGYSKWTVGSASETLGANDIIVKYTYNGDLNLDGAVDGNAATIFSTFYDNGATSGNVCAYGDLNGDGKIDGNDATIFSTVYGNGLASSGLPQL